CDQPEHRGDDREQGEESEGNPSEPAAQSRALLLCGMALAFLLFERELSLVLGMLDGLLGGTSFALLLFEHELFLAFSLFDGVTAGRQEPWQVVAVSDLLCGLSCDPAFGLGKLDGIEQADAAAASLDPLRGVQLEQTSALLVVATRQEPALKRRP